MRRPEPVASGRPGGRDKPGTSAFDESVADPGSTPAEAVWFGGAERPALGWLSRPPGRVFSSGVLIAPPVGYPYWGSHRTLRVMAQALARAGHGALRIDYDGTGDSAGDQWDRDRLQAWRRTVAAGAALLRELGADALTIVGARLGATIALLDGHLLGADAVVAWMPVLSGRRYAKELLLLSEPVPERHDPLDPPGTRVVAGNVFSSQTLSDLRALRVEGLGPPPARRMLVLDDPAGAAAQTVSELRRGGAEVTHQLLAGAETAFERAPEHATVPTAHVEAVVDWLGAIDGAPAAARSSAGPSASRARIVWRGEPIEEEVIVLAPAGHVAIVTSPAGSHPRGATLVLFNPGSETHIGPGRAWVELARDLALAGRRAVRVDFLGWGESPDAGRAPGRPYDQAGVADTISILQGLEAIEIGPLVPFGLCASAWIVLRAALEARSAGVIALNPQLYWKPGDPVEIDWDLVRARRAREIQRIERGARIGAWSLLDAVGHRPPAARWLQRLAATEMPVHILFRDGDDGLKFLRERLGRRVAELQADGAIEVTVVPEVDHALHLTWLRPRITSAVLDLLDRIDATGREER